MEGKILIVGSDAEELQRQIGEFVGSRYFKGLITVSEMSFDGVKDKVFRLSVKSTDEGGESK